ncbi:MAG TPA: ribokinase [Acidobacteriaceae bacterium]|nr:ribokinase [Acidobacteriaceae bacterium]
MRKKLLVVGSINIDLVACANRLPAPGETILGSTFDVFNGGKGANQAVAVAKLGAPVEMIGSLGTDLFTERLLSGLKAAGVDTHAVQMVAGPCGVAHISRADNGENSIIVISGANRLLSAAYIDAHRETVQRASMILVQLETPLEAVIRLAEQASEAKTPLMLDPAPAMPLPEVLLSRTTWLTPNETEAQILLGRVKIDPGAAAEKLLAMGVRNVALKLGSQGVFLAGRDCPAQQVPAFTVNAVDTTAAGDCFNAAFAVALTRKKPPVEAARYASAAAAISVTRAGAQPSLPSSAEVEAFLARAS